MEFTGTLAAHKTPLPLVVLHQCPAIGRSSRTRAGIMKPDSRTNGRFSGAIWQTSAVTEIPITVTC